MNEWRDKQLVNHGRKDVIDGYPKLWRGVDLLGDCIFVGKQVERA